MPLKNSDMLDANKIQANMPFGSINYFNSVNSTNHWLLDHGKHGDICISEEQTDGRGRRGNSWLSPDSGNIYFSLCWYFDEIIPHQSLLGLVVGVAVSEALALIGLNGHGVKWPNDIFYNQQKLGGILLETIGRNGRIVIGIGLNVNMPDSISQMIDQEATSINKALNGTLFSRDELIILLIQKLHLHLTSFAMLDVDSFINKWKKWDILKGKAVSFIHQNREVTGEVTSIDKNGRLGILTLSNNTEYYSSADIKLRKMR